MLGSFLDDRSKDIFNAVVGIMNRHGFPNYITERMPNYGRIIGETETCFDAYNLKTEFKIMILDEVIRYAESSNKTHWREFFDEDERDWLLDNEERILANKESIKISSEKMVKALEEFKSELEEIYEVEQKTDQISKIQPVNIDLDKEDIKTEIENVRIPHKIVLLYELGLYDLLRERINSNGGTTTDLAKLLSYVIGENESANYIYSFLSNPILDPFNSNYNNPAKDSPFTKTAIKKMKQILLDCHLQPKKQYPEKPLKRINRNKK